MYKLREVSEQLKKIVIENDVAAVITLHTPGRALTALCISPSFSIATVEGEAESTLIALTTVDLPEDKITTKVLTTANMLAHLGDSSKKNAEMFLEVLNGLVREFKKGPNETSQDSGQVTG